MSAYGLEAERMPTPEEMGALFATIRGLCAKVEALEKASKANSTRIADGDMARALSAVPGGFLR